MQVSGYVPQSIPAIGINLHTKGTEEYEDTQIDILSGKVIDLEILEHIPEIKDNPQAMRTIAELVAKMPDTEVIGSLPEDKITQYKPLAKVEELEEANYNMIDNVLNNAKPQKQEEGSQGRISIKDKLNEKKVFIDQRSEPEKEPIKKPEREI